MTTDIDARGRDASAALRTLVDDAIDGSATDLDLAAVVSGRAGAPAASRLQPVHRHPYRAAVVVATTAAAVIALLILVQRDDSKTPVAPPPTAVTATTTPDTTTPATTSDTTEVAPTLPAVNPTLQTIGPDLVGGVDILPYPPNAIALSDGRVLKIQSGFGVPGRFQLFDPATGEVTDAGAPLVDRSNPVMVELADGRVLVGGGDNTPPVDGISTIADSFTGEVFDPATGTSVATGPMASTWPAHGALLPNGQVLIVGPTQRPSGAVAEPAELYDPVSNSFLVASRRSDAGTATDLVPLADGRLLVVARPPELYDPATGEFSPLGVDAGFRIPAAHVALADGSLLLIDGHCSETNGDGGDAVATQRFDPAAGTLTAGPNIPHCVETATQFPNGELLVTGFAMTDTGSVAWAGVLDPTTGVVREVTAPTRRTPRAFAMPDGSVVLVAGVPIDDSNSMPWADVYRP